MAQRLADGYDTLMRRTIPRAAYKRIHVARLVELIRHYRGTSAAYGDGSVRTRTANHVKADALVVELRTLLNEIS